MTATRLPLCLSSRMDGRSVGYAIRCTDGPAAGAWWSGGGWNREEISVHETRAAAEAYWEDETEGDPYGLDLVSEIVRVRRGVHYA